MLEYTNRRKIVKNGKIFYVGTAKCPYCGTFFDVRITNLRIGQKSCGCKKGNIKHMMKGTRPYQTWRGMKDRCTNPNTKYWKRYGGRGIKICKEWLNFECFWKDMKDTYDDTLSIDRIDNNGDYEPSNCRWATMEEQSINKENSIIYNGESARQAGIRINGNPSLVYQRINAGWDKERAFTLPSRRPRTK